MRGASGSEINSRCLVSASAQQFGMRDPRTCTVLYVYMCVQYNATRRRVAYERVCMQVWSCREKVPRVAKTSAEHRMFPTLKFLLMMQENLVLVRTCSSHGGISTTYSSTTYSSMFEPVRNQYESLDSGCVAHAMAVRTKPLRLGVIQ